MVGYLADHGVYDTSWGAKTAWSSWSNNNYVVNPFRIWDSIVREESDEESSLCRLRKENKQIHSLESQIKLAKRLRLC